MIVDEAQFILIRGMDRLNGEPQQCILILPVRYCLKFASIYFSGIALLSPPQMKAAEGERNQRMQRQGLGSGFGARV